MSHRFSVLFVWATEAQRKKKRKLLIPAVPPCLCGYSVFPLLIPRRAGWGKLASFIHLHAQRQTHVRENFLDLVQRFAAEILGPQHFLLRLLDELADGLDVGIFQAV